MNSIKLPLENIIIYDSIKSIADALKPSEAESLLRGYELIKTHHSCSEAVLVVEILHSMHLGCNTLIAALLYYAYADNSLLHDTITVEFDETVINLIRGLQQLESVKQKNKTAAYQVGLNKSLVNLRKMLIAVVKDISIVFIKLAQHLCKMRSSIYAAPEIKLSLAYETMQVYAPLANRLGIGQIKWELEDLAFRFQHPEDYKHIVNLLDEGRIDREVYIDKVIQHLSIALQDNNITANIHGRVKHIYSIWRKMVRKHIDYHEIYDIYAIRVLVDKIPECYTVLGVIHSIWQSIQREFDDYIANPKANGYKSLHIAIIGPEGKPIEIQIRTKDMHEQAELGMASHWRYKEGSKHDPDYEKKLATLRQILKWQDELQNIAHIEDNDNIDNLKKELFIDRVYVFTHTGEVVDLPRGATPLDFAYHIHSELGHRCRGAKINGAIQPLIYQLNSGDQVEIIATKHGEPSLDWLNPNLKYIVTARAKAKIHQWFNKRNREANIISGREALHKELKRLNITNYDVKKLLTNLPDCNTEDDLHAKIGLHQVKIAQILNILHPPVKIQKEQKIENNKNLNNNIYFSGVGKLSYALAKCCNPQAPQEIIGYITINNGVTIHKKDCANILKLNSHNNKSNQLKRLLEANWGVKATGESVSIIVKAYKRNNLLRDITNIIALENINISKLNTLDTNNDLCIIFKITFEISSLSALSNLISKLEQLSNIKEIYKLAN